MRAFEENICPGSSPSRPPPITGPASSKTVWVCRTLDGIEAQHVRLDYRQGPKRIFWQYRDANGRTAKGLPSGCKAVDFLYFSGNKDSTHAVITEGEKATEAAAGALPSVRALGTVCGAATRPTSRALRRALEGLDTVTLWPDHDSDGLKHMDRIGTALASMGFEVKLVQVTDLPDKSDAADLWGNAIRTRIAEAVPWTPLIAGKREPDALVPDVLPAQKYPTCHPVIQVV